MKLLRRKIYIGETSQGLVYFDTKTNQALLAPKSRLLDTGKSNHRNRLLAILIFILVTGAVSFFLKDRLLTGYYTAELLLFLLFIWLAEFVGMVYLMESALYKYVRLAKSTNRQLFRQAAYSNLIWNNFSDKKVTRGKKIWAVAVMAFFACSNLAFVFLFYIWLKGDVEVVEGHMGLLGAPVGSELVGFSLFGLFPAIAVLLIWQNNPYRFFRALETH